MPEKANAPVVMKMSCKSATTAIIPKRQAETEFGKLRNAYAIYKIIANEAKITDRIALFFKLSEIVGPTLSKLSCSLSPILDRSLIISSLVFSSIVLVLIIKTLSSVVLLIVIGKSLF